jgi:3-phosphoshikimate 1-carboxyvinyltransferase
MPLTADTAGAHRPPTTTAHRIGAPDRPTAPGGIAILTVTGPSTLHGTIRVPGDKSISHRAVMLSALAAGTSLVRGLSDGADVRHTVAAVAALGAHVVERDDEVAITGGTLTEPRHALDVGNSGTGIRLLAGIAAGLPFRTRLDGDESVRARPMDRVAEPLRLMGARVDGRQHGRFAPLEVEGGSLRGVEYATPVASAQIKSALLLAGLAAEGPTVVHEPALSRRHTEEMLAARGVDIVADGTTTILTPSASSALSPLDCTVAGDPSQAAFWLVTAAAVPGSEVSVPGLYLGPARGGFLDVLRRMGADVESRPAGGEDGDPAYDVTVRSATLRATEITPEEIPGLVDEIPILAVAAALAEGTTTIRGAAELRVKETDRLATVAGMLRALGVAVVERPDGLDVTGGTIRSGTVDSFGDHRIAMAAAMAAVATRGSVSIRRFEAVATSYPQFLGHLAACAPEVVIDPQP